MRPSSHPRSRLLPALVLTALAALVQNAHAQTEAMPIEGNIRIEYAEVLRVEPVHSSADTCPAPPAPPAPRAAMAAPGRAANGNGMMLSLNTGRSPSRPSAPPIAPQTTSDETTQPDACAPQDSEGEVAQLMYDVDYILRGVKYRSRLPYDPGNRLQVQLSITPVMPPESDPPPES